MKLTDIRAQQASGKARDWFRIQNTVATDSGPSSATVYVYGVIGDSWFSDSVPAGDFVRELAALDVDQIDLHIHSPGGDVFDGLAIANAIRTHPANVTAYVDGLAASAASFIATAAEEVVMTLGAELMIHDAWGICVGPAQDMAKTAELLDHTSNNLASLYAAKAGGTTEDWRALMREETWYSAQEAVDAKLADRIDQGKTKPETAKNQFDLSIFAHAGRADAPPPVIPGHARAQQPPAEPPADPTTPNPEGADMSDTLISGLRERLGIKDADLSEEQLLAALDETLAEQTESTPATLPAGLVAVEQDVLNQLRADASSGREAREQQLADQRLNLVNAAIADGRVAPARRDHWVAALKADPEGGEQTLASLAPGLVPLSPVGFTGGVEESSDDDRLYASLFGADDGKVA